METKSSLLPERESLQLYLKEVGRSSPVSHQQEIALAARIRDGDAKALEEMVLANLRFVVSVARGYQHQGVPLSDLINEGNLGLIRAAKRFDGGKNFKFISYAVWWVRQAILQALAEQSRIVTLPLNRVGTIYKIGKAFKRLEQRYGRGPEPDEIARETHLKEKDVRDSMSIGDRHVSLDAPTDIEENSRLLDTLSDDRIPATDAAVQEMSLQQELERCMSELQQREREVISLYFGLGEEAPHTLEEIGDRFQLTRERARQIKERALRRLRLSASGQSASDAAARAPRPTPSRQHRRRATSR
jgi:RNA polymerase primary sigma factor